MLKCLPILLIVTLSACSTKFNYSDAVKTQAANSLCAEALGAGTKATYYYYTGEAANTAIGLHCGNDPYKQTKVKVSRSAWDEKLAHFSSVSHQ